MVDGRETETEMGGNDGGVGLRRLCWTALFLAIRGAPPFGANCTHGARSFDRGLPRNWSSGPRVQIPTCVCMVVVNTQKVETMWPSIGAIQDPN